MKILRWMSGVTRKNRIRIGCIRKKFEVVPIEDKMGDSPLRWYSHV